MDPPRVEGEAVDVVSRRLPSRAFGSPTLGDGEASTHDQALPLLSRLAALTTSAATADLRQASVLRAVIEEYMDSLLLHRSVVTVVLTDPAGGSSEAARRVRDAIAALRDELARGTGSELDGRIRAASALGAVQAAVLEPSEFDPATVRNVIAAAAVAILLS
jgi:hypothetical protein